MIQMQFKIRKEKFFNVIFIYFCIDPLVWGEKKTGIKRNTQSVVGCWTTKKVPFGNITGTKKSISPLFILGRIIHRDIFIFQTYIKIYSSNEKFGQRWIFPPEFPTISEEIDEKNKEERGKKRLIEYFWTNNGRKQYDTKGAFTLYVEPVLGFRVCACGAFSRATTAWPMDFIRTEWMEIKVRVSIRKIEDFVFELDGNKFGMWRFEWDWWYYGDIIIDNEQINGEE